MILVDSSVWIDFFNGRDSAKVKQLDLLFDRDLIVIGDLILTEVLQGFTKDNDYKTAKELLRKLLFMEMLGKGIVIKSADNYRRLRKKGITPRKTIDIIIATFCSENKITLLHSDKDFDTIAEYLHLKIYT